MAYAGNRDPTLQPLGRQSVSHALVLKVSCCNQKRTARSLPTDRARHIVKSENKCFARADRCYNDEHAIIAQCLHFHDGKTNAVSTLKVRSAGSSETTSCYSLSLSLSKDFLFRLFICLPQRHKELVWLSPYNE
jgi:hypothetical protein